MPKVKPLPPPAFDWASDARGYWAQLRDGHYTVTLTEYPQSLLSMLRAKVLVGTAKADALNELWQSLRRRLSPKEAGT